MAPKLPPNRNSLRILRSFIPRLCSTRLPHYRDEEVLKLLLVNFRLESCDPPEDIGLNLFFIPVWVKIASTSFGQNSRGAIGFGDHLNSFCVRFVLQDLDHRGIERLYAQCWIGVVHNEAIVAQASSMKPELVPEHRNG
jgi:hypothetical protein